MGGDVKTRRRYDSPRRREQARATRHSILEGARQLFVERGYVATRIEDVAVQAGVSPETIYATFRTKRALLSELVDHAIAGGAAAPAVIDQAWVDRLRREGDLGRRLEILARNGRAILERRAALDEVVRAAAASDPEIAELRARGTAQRYAGQRALLQLVAGEEALAEGLDLDAAVDVMYAIGSPETYRLLVVDRRWAPSRFERWYRETLARLIFDQ